MLIPDVNVLVAAFRADAVHHGSMRRWLLEALASEESIGLSTSVATGVLRVLTHPRIFAEPDTIDAALGHLDALRANAGVLDVAPGARHVDIVTELCRAADARGNLVADAAHAAIAIEHGATWVSLDRDFARFEGLRWVVPA